MAPNLDPDDVMTDEDVPSAAVESDKAMVEKYHWRHMRLGKKV
jgi:hypothetical protein